MVPTISALKLFHSGDVMQALFGEVNQEIKEKNALKGGVEKSNNAGCVSLQSGSKHMSETLQNLPTINFSGAKKTPEGKELLVKTLQSVLQRRNITAEQKGIFIILKQADAAKYSWKLFCQDDTR